MFIKIIFLDKARRETNEVITSDIESAFNLVFALDTSEYVHAWTMTEGNSPNYFGWKKNDHWNKYKETFSQEDFDMYSSSGDNS